MEETAQGFKGLYQTPRLGKQMTFRAPNGYQNVSIG